MCRRFVTRLAVTALLLLVGLYAGLPESWHFVQALAIVAAVLFFLGAIVLLLVDIFDPHRLPTSLEGAFGLDRRENAQDCTD